MEQTTPSTTIQIRQDSNESGPYISNILHDYDDDETVTKKLAKYGYDNDVVVDAKPAAATCNSNQGDDNQEVVEIVAVTDQEVVTTPSVSTTTSTETGKLLDSWLKRLWSFLHVLSWADVGTMAGKGNHFQYESVLSSERRT